MEYIAHHDFYGMTEAEKILEIPKGTVLPVIGYRIAMNNASVCTIKSNVAYKYFARNDDGNGLERGKLTYAIAYEPRERIDKDGHVFRFSEQEINLLERKYEHFLKPVNAIVFNHEFFNAEIDELRKMAEDLNIEVK